MFKTLFWQPILNILFLTYHLVKDFGLSVVLTTVLIRLTLWPLFTQNELLQKRMSKIQPRLKEIQKEYKTDPQKQTMEMLALYKENKINPSFAFFFAFFQIFIIFGLFSAFKVSTFPYVKSLTYLYPWVLKNLSEINYGFLGLVDLKKPSLVFAIVATITQVAQGLISLKGLAKNDPQRGMLMTFTYVFPVIFILSYKTFPTIIFMYWTVLTLINIAQTLYVRKIMAKTN